MSQVTRERAEQICAEWSEMMKDRDRRVLAAVRSGMPKVEVAWRMGISHNTVYAILRKHREQAGSPTPYTCPQCGPDPNGADVHAEMRHTWPPATSVDEARERLGKHREQASE